MIAAYISKSVDKPGTLPITGGALRKDSALTQAIDGTERSFKITEHIPGLVIEELQVGEEPKAFPSTGTDEKFGEFEEAIIQAVAWANEIPPEILKLSFSSNYSASQAAINEFKMYLTRVRTSFGDTFCQPIYVEWLLSEALNQRVQADGLLESWRDARLYDTFGAWTSADWSGHIKPSTDIFKQARGLELMLSMGALSRDRMSREATGTKFSKNVKKLRRENEQLAEALKPLADAEAKARAAANPADDSEAATPRRGRNSRDDDPDDEPETVESE
jgi:capsid protein